MVKDLSTSMPAAPAGLPALHHAVMQLLRRNRKPLTAYQILSDLGPVMGRQLYPQTIYRALDELSAGGHVERVESLKAYTPVDVRVGQPRAIFVCESCHDTVAVPIPAAAEAIKQASSAQQFVIDHTAIEVKGHCKACT
jgi:Fur family zinc uptake transcriptional regulator